MTLTPRETALLVMDYQQAIVGMLDQPEEPLERAASAIALARAYGAHVGYVRVAFTEADLATVPEWSAMAARIRRSGGDAFLDGAPATAIHERVAPEPGDVIVRKTRVGAFSTTDLDAQLRERGVTVLVLAGISTSGVVLSTVRDASDRDYRLVVLSDACADPDPEVHSCLLERVFPRQAEVVTVAELEGLMND